MPRKSKSQKQQPTVADPLDIPEDEQWRLINDSGILRKAGVTSTVQRAPDEDEDTPFAEEVFSAIVLIIPFSFLLLMMEMYVPTGHLVLLLNRPAKFDSFSVWATALVTGYYRQDGA